MEQEKFGFVKKLSEWVSLYTQRGGVYSISFAPDHEIVITSLTEKSGYEQYTIVAISHFPTGSTSECATFYKNGGADNSALQSQILGLMTSVSSHMKLLVDETVNHQGANKERVVDAREQLLRFVGSIIMDAVPNGTTLLLT